MDLNHHSFGIAEASCDLAILPTLLKSFVGRSLMPTVCIPLDFHPTAQQNLVRKVGNAPTSFGYQPDALLLSYMRIDGKL